ncbi:AbrB/MazE/SpoVT family DNA-binding domain-containing protein [Hydrogenophaga sp.]|uniref:AbrB/MazE/SpoVT family DNA-binding domain-containing protein n=1 Tax=Hydrogenophaga sp. TaxID=1904254 RepID=UPI003F70000F
MAAAIVRTNGRLTIPAKVRRALALHAGDRVEFVELEQGEFLMVAANRSLTDLKGMFGRPSKVVSIEEMNRVVAARGTSRH